MCCATDEGTSCSVMAVLSTEQSREANQAGSPSLTHQSSTPTTPFRSGLLDESTSKITVYTEWSKSFSPSKILK